MVKASANFTVLWHSLFFKSERFYLKQFCGSYGQAAPWGDLSTEFGSHSTVFNKFNRWSKSGIWRIIFIEMLGELDDEWNFIDVIIIRAHQASGRKFIRKIKEF